ncbi:hypothetical protein FRC04_007127, partial [Tulasnella sp. 424]
MTADASGTMGASAPKGMRVLRKAHPRPHQPDPAALTLILIPIPPRPATAAAAMSPAPASQVTQTPPPSPSPLLKPIPDVEEMKLPIHKSITQS